MNTPKANNISKPMAPLRITAKGKYNYNKVNNGNIDEEDETVWPVNLALVRSLTPEGNSPPLTSGTNLRWANKPMRNNSTNAEKKEYLNIIAKKKSTSKTRKQRKSSSSRRRKN